MSEKEAFDRKKEEVKKSEAAKPEAQPQHLAAAVKQTAARKARMAGKAEAAGEAKGPNIKAEHTVVSGDTLSGMAQKYYGSAAREKWMAIYEANKETIGDNPSLIRVGQVLQIPELDD